MYGLNAVALVFFGCINVAAYQLCKCPEGRRRTVVRWLCAVLLSGNLLRYGIIYPFVKGVVMLPVEFSTVAYFLVPAILLTSKRRLRSWAAYSGLMAGFFYYLAMIAAGGVIYGTYAPLDIYISMFCHGSIYFCGFVTIGTELCSAKDAPKLALGVAWVAIRAAILRPFVVGSDRLLIYILLDAVAVKKVFRKAPGPSLCRSTISPSQPSSCSPSAASSAEIRSNTTSFCPAERLRSAEKWCRSKSLRDKMCPVCYGGGRRDDGCRLLERISGGCACARG